MAGIRAGLQGGKADRPAIAPPARIFRHGYRIEARGRTRGAQRGAGHWAPIRGAADEMLELLLVVPAIAVAETLERAGEDAAHAQRFQDREHVRELRGRTDWPHGEVIVDRRRWEGIEVHGHPWPGRPWLHATRPQPGADIRGPARAPRPPHGRQPTRPETAAQLVHGDIRRLVLECDAQHARRPRVVVRAAERVPRQAALIVQLAVPGGRDQLPGGDEVGLDRPRRSAPVERRRAAGNRLDQDACIQGVNVMPISRPSGLSSRDVVWPHGSSWASRSTRCPALAISATAGATASAATKLTFKAFSSIRCAAMVSAPCGSVRSVDRRALLAILRIGFAGLAVAAIITQLLDLAGRGVLDPVNFFSYFTIQSNLIAVAALLWTVAIPAEQWTRAHDLFRGAATTYITVTFVVFALLLADTDVDTAIPWVDRVLHRVIPIVLMADWLVDPPRVAIGFRASLWWLAYPAAWTAYTLVRGALVGRYPYPFLDPASGGYGTVLIYCVAILIGMVVVIVAVTRIGNGMRALRS